MFLQTHLVSLVTLLPLLLGALVMLIPKGQSKLVWGSSILGTTLIFGLSMLLVKNFDESMAGHQFLERISWIPELGISFDVGIDGISLWLVVLTTALTPLTLLASVHSIETRVKGFVVCMLFLETAMLGAFVSLNLFLFYLFWEAMLIPMFFIIGIWGGDNRIYASIKFFLYTLAGSLLMLAAIIWVYWLHKEQFQESSFYFADLYRLKIPMETQKILFVAFFLAFAIKVPLFPFHTWLPDAHVQAPTPGSVILAGVLLKMGIYGFLRLGLPIFPGATVFFAPYIMILSAIGIVYGALVAWVQTDIKKLVAYSSVSHLGYCMLGLFALNLQGIQGSLIQMINHGISTGALFLLVGCIYERRHTREIKEFGGLAAVVPIFATVFVIVMLSSIALPLTNGFVGEYLILFSSFRSSFEAYQQSGGLGHFIIPVVSVTGVVFGAVYMLLLTQKLLFGKLSNPKNEGMEDLTFREKMIFVPFIVMIFVIGLKPSLFFEKSEASVKKVIEQVMQGKSQ